MPITKQLPQGLMEKESFSRKDFVEALKSEYGMTTPQIAYNLKNRLDDGSIIHSGWDTYVFKGEKLLYNHKYSREAEEVVSTITAEYADVVFQVAELTQLNTFVNHLIVHNTIFVQVEKALQDFVFDTLKNAFPGRVMLRPKVDEYYRYRLDNEIIVSRLPSEAPKGLNAAWQSRLEKILVDVFTDKLMSEIVPNSEKEAIITGAFDLYLIDTKTMIRYAKRKGAEKRIEKLLNEYGVMKGDYKRELL